MNCAISSAIFRLCLLVAVSAAPVAALTSKAPAGVKLPVTMTPVPGSDAWSGSGPGLVLAAGRNGMLEAAAWFTANRPPRGEMVVLEMEYLDGLKQMATVEVYSGLSTDRPFTEVHRFGGFGDGQWRTVRAPAPADMIYLHLPSRTIRFRISSPGGELRIRQARLVAPLPDEQARYEAACREWVARVQKRAAIDPSYWRLAETPVLPGKWAGRRLVPFARNYMDLVLPISAPKAGEAGSGLSARMFLNEYEPLQLGVYANGADLKGVTATVEPLRDGSGKVVAEAELRVAEYSLVKGWNIPNYFVEPFPQRLWPAYAFDVPAGRSHMLLITLHTGEDFSRAGRYSTVVRLRAEREGGADEATVPLTLEILDQRLLTMEEAGLKLGGCTSGLLPEFEMEWLKQNNHNMVNIWYQSDRPEMTRNGASFDLDFRLMDDFMLSARRAGMTDMVYFLGGNPYGFPQTVHLPRKLAATMLGLDDRGWRDLSFRDPNNVPEEIAAHVVEWARRFRAHADSTGWPNVILTPFDEPAKWHQYTPDKGMLHFIKPQFKQLVSLLRQGDPKVQIYGSIHHYYGGIDFLPDVDIFCTNAVAENWNLPNEVREAGKTLWQYSGTTDKGLPGVARYTFGWYFAGHDSRGSLVWAYNWGHRFDTLDGENWMYAWQTPFGMLPAPFMTGLREAWDDRRLLETLKRRAAGKGVDLSGFLTTLFGEVAAMRGQGGTSTLDDFWERSRSDRSLDLWKSRLVQKLSGVGPR
jgi:hypothetical protein